VHSEPESDYVDFVTHHANGMWRRYRNWSKVQREGSIVAYTRKVVVSATLDGLRRRSSTEVVGGDSYFDGEADPTDHVGRAERRLMITQALAELGG